MAKRSVSPAAIIFRTVYVTLGAVGIFASLGWFDRSYNTNWYVYYTNLSNYICWTVMFISLIASAKGKRTVLPHFRFYCLIMIMVTFFVYNILLSDEYTTYEYFTNISCTLLHCVLPAMFFLDWIFFTERRCVRWFDPLASAVMPLIYVAFVVLRGRFIDAGAKDVVVYPYFFLDKDKLGVSGFALWIVVLVAVFVLLGYLLYAFDKIRLKR